MANRTYLFYKNHKNEWEEFEYWSEIPSLWQELYTYELLEEQEDNLITAFEINEEKDNSTLKIPLNIAIKNLENQTKTSRTETDDKKQLRLEFLNFLKLEVAKNTTIELAFEEISWFYETPKDFFQSLKNFHLKVAQSNQLEKISFQTIGINSSFEAYSIVYKRLNDEDKIRNARNAKLNQQHEEKIKKQEEKSNKRSLIFMTFIALVLTFFAPYGFFVKEDIKNGIFIFCICIVLWTYIYLKHFKKW